MTLPVLWSFRRCPYAMRARLAIQSSGQCVELREIVLRNKREAFLATSPTGTVPCLDLGGEVIDESFDIMRWALEQKDPEGWLVMPDDGYAHIKLIEGPFKIALDRYKYASRYTEEDIDVTAERATAASVLREVTPNLSKQEFLFGDTPTLADMAILPFVRQFAHVDFDWFSSQDWPEVFAWLERFKASDRFKAIMSKYKPWQPGDVAIPFPECAL